LGKECSGYAGGVHSKKQYPFELSDGQSRDSLLLSVYGMTFINIYSSPYLLLPVFIYPHQI